ncbi:MAG: DoxX-like family protein [Gammaproteobacteria bacterium]|nr:DoxX-like family protein [Gammaproteobacteria bacterium]
MNIVQLSRFVLGFSWIYHGLFPKLLFLAPLELEMSGSIGLAESNTLWLIRFAGVSEVIFGILLLVFYKHVMLLYLNIAGFLALVVFVLIMTPHLMVEAFNPVTTNLPLIVLSLILIHEAKKGGSEST